VIPVQTPRRLGAIPLPIFIGMIAILAMILPGAAQLSPALRFEPAYANAILYTVFISLTSFAVAYLSLKSYLRNGSVVLVLLGGGALAWGSMALIGSWLTNLPAGPNIAITIVNTGGLVASIFHAASGTLVSKNSSSKNGVGVRKPLLGSTYTSVVVFTAALTIASLDGLVPLFFVPGVGQTPLRMFVIGASTALFGVSSILFARLYFSSRSPILYWYFLALGMTAVGIGAVFFGRAPGDPISWTGRAAQFLGGVYFLKAVLTTFKQANESTP
jgi:hypothetical protein